MSVEPLALFDEPEHTVPAPVEPEYPPDATEGERLRIRQARAIEAGQHPLGAALGFPLPLHPDARRDVGDWRDGTPRCGTCAYRERVTFGPGYVAKCLEPSAPGRRGHVRRAEHPRVTNGPATTVKRGWPACQDYYRPGTVVPPG